MENETTKIGYSQDALTSEQEIFCHYYSQNSELFGNATLSYAEAYDYKLDDLSREKPILEYNDKNEPIEWGKSQYQIAYDQASAFGSRLMRKDKIQKRVRTLLNEMLKDEVVDAQLAEIILEGNDGDKIQAIREYNKLRQRIVDKKDITSAGKAIVFLPAEIAEKNNIKTDDIPS